MEIKENLDSFVARNIENFAVLRKFGPIDEFKLKDFDQILIKYLPLGILEAVEKEIENGELACIAGVANKVLRL